MFAKLVLVCLALLFLTATAADTPTFEQWAGLHGVAYTRDPLEMELRRAIWEDNLRYIQEYNDRGTGVTLEMNRFGDLTHTEFQALSSSGRSTLERAGHVTKFKSPVHQEPPASKDWRKEGVVGPVRNQGTCGACYAFSAVATVESMLAIKKGKYVALSVQQVVDCSGPWGNHGCEGGTPENVFKYLHDTPGLEAATDYPCTGTEGVCRADCNLSLAHVDRYVKIKKYSEIDLKAAVGLVGPVSVEIDAGERSFQFYASGIYSDPMCITARIDHAVVVVGYGAENGQDYWIVRNTWGTGWGMKGYVLIARNKQNMCGIASQAIYPIVSPCKTQVQMT